MPNIIINIPLTQKKTEFCSPFGGPLFIQTDTLGIKAVFNRITKIPSFSQTNQPFWRDLIDTELPIARILAGRFTFYVPRVFVPENSILIKFLDFMTSYSTLIFSTVGDLSKDSVIIVADSNLLTEDHLRYHFVFFLFDFLDQIIQEKPLSANMFEFTLVILKFLFDGIGIFNDPCTLR